jgi:hypothetical protein
MIPIPAFAPVPAAAAVPVVLPSLVDEALRWLYAASMAGLEPLAVVAIAVVGVCAGGWALERRSREAATPVADPRFTPGEAHTPSFSSAA